MNTELKGDKYNITLKDAYKPLEIEYPVQNMLFSVQVNTSMRIAIKQHVKKSLCLNINRHF